MSIKSITKERSKFGKQLKAAMKEINSGVVRVPLKPVLAKQLKENLHRKSSHESTEDGKELVKLIGGLVGDLQKAQYFQNLSLKSILAGVADVFRAVLSEGSGKFTGQRGNPQQAPFVTIVDESGREVNFEKLFTGLTIAMNQMKMGGIKRTTLTNEVRNETPSGSINSSNKTFLLASQPIADRERIYLNGIRLSGGGVDYTLSFKTLTFVVAPVTGSILLADYTK